jgi:anti-repressor protein
MNELIKIEQRDGKRVVDARELHAFLEVTSKFADWIKNRIEKYRFIEGQDYTTFSKNLEKGRPSTEYAITLNMAKELGMIENNQKGSLVRQYFLEMEEKAISAVAKSQALAPKPMNSLDFLQYSLDVMKEQAKRMEVLEEKVELIAAKQVTSSMDYFSVAGYWSYKKVKIDSVRAAAVSRKVKKLCTTLGHLISKVTDPRYGTVNTYPADALEVIFKEMEGGEY